MTKKPDSKGFGFVAVLVILVALVFVGLTGFYINQSNHKAQLVDKSKPQTTTAKKPNITHDAKKPVKTDPYAGWNTYMSSLGGFTLRYPAGWMLGGYVENNPVAPTAINGQENSLEISAPVNASNPSEGNVGVSVNVTTPNKSYVNSENSNSSMGTTTLLANGIKIWTNNSASDPTVADENAGRSSCVVTNILGKDDKSYYYGYPLNNGLYLGITASYCEGQKSTTSLSYKQQFESQQRKDAINIIASVVFN